MLESEAYTGPSPNQRRNAKHEVSTLFV
jgi:hypothetical protein